MSFEKKNLITVRDYTAHDHNFVLATWLRGLYYGNSFFSPIPKNIFMENYHKIITNFLLTPGLNIKVACLKDEPEVILGYTVLRNMKYGEADLRILDWVFVKSAWRKIGIAEMLIPQNTNVYTHSTKIGANIIRTKLPNCIFNPFVF